MNEVEIESLVILESLNRINRRLVQKGIKRWDEVGEGDFGQWISRYVALRFREIARWN